MWGFFNMEIYDKIIKYSGYLASALFITIGFIVSYEVIMRYIFNSPTVWVNEISRFLQIWATYLALTYTFHKKILSESLSYMTSLMRKVKRF
jgi:TRAP-type C4-dicarboxylate transport system permease small subunit